MILIADSGSTKTDWVLIDKVKGNNNFSTQGFNPFFFRSEEITKEIQKYFSNTETNNLIREIHFYGAGCSSDAMKEIIINGLQPVFINASITVKSDLLGAARALFFNDPGIAVILGTGASSGMYNGTYINKTIKSLGYVFGDEGGGDHIGKLFITDFLNDELAEDITQKFIETYHLSKDDILRKVYKDPSPNSFLASFCEFLSKNIENKQIDDIIQSSFNQFFKNHICKYPDYKNCKIRVLGSTGYYFEKQLKKATTEFEIQIDLIIKNPINELVAYHLGKIQTN